MNDPLMSLALGPTSGVTESFIFIYLFFFFWGGEGKGGGRPSQSKVKWGGWVALGAHGVTEYFFWGGGQRGGADLHLGGWGARGRHRNGVCTIKSQIEGQWGCHGVNGGRGRGGAWTPGPPYLNHWGLQVGKSGPTEENRICAINATADNTVSLNLISPIEWKLIYIYAFLCGR